MPFVPLSETLIRFQEEEERKVMATADDSNRDLMQEFYDRTKITSEDLSREYSEDDIKELCLRTKVRVNMTHMNCVWDAKKRFDRKGRLDNRSDRFINAMFVKAVKRGMVKPYTDEEVSKYHHINVCHTKKDNNIRLNRWKKERQRQLLEDLQSEDGLDADMDELVAAFPSEDDEYEAFMSVDDGKEQTEPLDMTSLRLVVENKENITHDDEEQRNEQNYEEADFEVGAMVDISMDNEHCDPVIEHVVPTVRDMPSLDPIYMDKEDCLDYEFDDYDEVEGKQQNNSNAPDVSQTEEMGENVDWLEDVNEINSESMTLNTEELLQESELLQTPRQDVAADYRGFNTQVTATSTQNAETQAFISII